MLNFQVGMYAGAYNKIILPFTTLKVNDPERDILGTKTVH